MDFVKIRGKDIQDCFMQMKMKYGPEAHVYEQREITDGGIFGSGLLAKKVYEIEVGIPEQQNSRERVEKRLQDLKELLKKKSDEDKKKKNLDDIKPIVEKNSNVFMDEHNESSDSFRLPMEKTEIGLSMKDEIAKKDMDSPHLLKLRERWIREGMSPEYATQIILKIDNHLSPVEKMKSSSVMEKSCLVMEDRISVDADLFSGAGRGKRKVVFFVGPTGSGKTTSIAKLAAKYFLHMGRMVSLYTLDNYRIAAVEQLKRYADTMEIPFFPIKDQKKLQEALHRDGSELVLIDTAGYSHRNPDFYEKMKMYREAFSPNDVVENILVVPATISYLNLNSVLEAYEKFGYSRILLTKIDETDSIGSILELADTYNKGFCYLSIGQEVPFDILPATKKSLSEMLILPEKIKDIKGEVFAIA